MGSSWHLLWKFCISFLPFTLNWTYCMFYGFHNAVLHSSSWHRLCLTAASALSHTPLLLLSFLSLARPLIMQSQQKAGLSLSLSFGFPDTQREAKGEEIRKGVERIEEKD